MTYQDSFNQGAIGALDIAARRRAAQAQQDDALTAAAVAYGFSPPGAGLPTPPPPGQASQPAAPPPQMAPPQQPLAGLAGPQAGPPQQAARPAPMPVAPPQAPPAIATPPQQAPPQAAQPSQTMPSAPPQQQQFGSMTLQGVIQQLMKSPQNQALFKQRPDLLMKAVERAQAAMAPEGRAELAQTKQNLEQEKANNQLYKIQQDAANKLMQAQSAEDRTRIMTESRNAIAQARQAGADAAHSDAVMVALAHLAQGDRRLDQGDRSLDQKDQKRRDSIITNAAKIGVEIPEGTSTDEAMKLTAQGYAKKFASALMPPNVVQFVGDAALTDSSILSHAFSGKSDVTAANKNAVLDYISKKGTPEQLAQAKVALAEKTAEARAEGAIGGTTAVGAQEIEQFAPLVLSDANKVNLGRFPSINAWNLWAKQHAGDPAVVKYKDNLQALQNAASLVLTRGGKMSDQARKLTQSLADGSMSPMQLKAAIQALREEAKGTGAAAKAATAGTVGSIKTPGGAPGSDVGGGNPAPGGDQPSADDPLGILQ